MNASPDLTAEEHDRFAVTERNVTHGSDNIALILGRNLAIQYPLLCLLSAQCPNVHQLNIAVPVDLNDEKDLFAQVARRRLSAVLDEDSPKAPMELQDVYVAYEELPAAPLSKYESWLEVKKLSGTQLRSLLFQMCNAVASMHHILDPRDNNLPPQTLIHADLKPSQFLFSKPGSPKETPSVWLTDFETATGNNELSCLQKAGSETFFGSNRYALPAVFSEQNHRYTTEDDIYAFAWTVADIVFSLQTDKDYINVDRPDTFSYDKATRVAAIRNYLSRLEQVTSPQFAHAIEVIVLSYQEAPTDISTYWAEYLQPAIESLYGLSHEEMIFSHQRKDKV